jgi:hydrophobic/amphiphilic exporter-1 (mainly G- bacteria), HAE1 family
LTLVVVPVVYCWLDDLGQWAKRVWRRNTPHAAPVSPALTPKAEAAAAD